MRPLLSVTVVATAVAVYESLLEVRPESCKVWWIRPSQSRHAAIAHSHTYMHAALVVWLWPTVNLSLLK